LQIGSCGVNPAEFKYHFQDAGPQNDYPYKGKQKGMHVEKDYGPQKVKNQLEYVAEHGVKNVIRIYSFLLADTRAADAHQYVEGCPYDWKQYGRGRQGWFAQQVINIDIITRIASSSPDMWESICMSNAENIADLLDDYIASLQTVNRAVRSGQKGFTYDLFTASKEYRDSFADLPKGPIKKVFACYVDIPDEAGSIAALATLLAKADISIKNIGIVHNRDFEEGVLRIEFYEQPALDEAVTLLQGLQYTVHPRK